MLLQKLISDPSPVTCIDTHAGPSLYDLGGPAQRGILQLITPQPPSLGGDPLHAYIHAALAGTAGAGKYRGSPLLALQWLRPQDQAIFYEMSREAFLQLKDMA